MLANHNSTQSILNPQTTTKKMKTKASLIATAATIALFGAAKGQTVIDITGSTAGRSAVNGRIQAILTGETIAWKGNAALNSANQAIFKGTYGATPVIVRTSWTGSAAGVRDVSNALQLTTFIDTSWDTVANPGQQESAPFAAASAATVAEIGFSDVFQTSTAFNTNTLADQEAVAVLPFLFMKNDGASPKITNMTGQAFRTLFGGTGVAPLSLWSGITADNAFEVRATGRDNLSGTRITTVAETGQPLSLNLAQYTGTGDPATLTFVGNGGYSSGGNVATLLSATGDNDLIGYIGTSDGTTAATGGATYLKYNGVDYSQANVYNGTYTLWGYLHQSTMLDITNVGDTTVDFYNELKIQMIALPVSASTLPIGNMKVERGADGAKVTPL
jgi:hypothetical protein